MRSQLTKSIKYNELLDMIYMAKNGQISKRRIRVLQVGDVSFRAYCFLRKSNRTFIIDNVLALVPIKVKGNTVI